MKVKELIEVLQKLNQETEILIDNNPIIGINCQPCYFNNYGKKLIYNNYNAQKPLQNISECQFLMADVKYNLQYTQLTEIISNNTDVKFSIDCGEMPDDIKETIQNLKNWNKNKRI
jgi:hypothetical protein